MLVSQQHSSKKHEPRLKVRPVFELYCLLAGGGRRGITGLLLGLHVLICKINEASIQLLQHDIWWQRKCETFLPSPLKVLPNYSVSWSNSRTHRVSDHKDKARENRECFVLSIKDHQTQDHFNWESSSSILPALRYKKEARTGSNAQPAHTVLLFLPVLTATTFCSRSKETSMET